MADGELVGDSGVMLERHLTICRNCRDSYRDRQFLLLQLDSSLSETIALPAGFAAKINKMAISGPSIFGERVASWTEMIIFWFVAATLLNPLSSLFTGKPTSDRGAMAFHSALTDMGGLVNILASAMDSIGAVIVARFLSIL
jgi:hypothetical protein